MATLNETLTICGLEVIAAVPEEGVRPQLMLSFPKLDKALIKGTKNRASGIIGPDSLVPQTVSKSQVNAWAELTEGLSVEVKGALAGKMLPKANAMVAQAVKAGGHTPLDFMMGAMSIIKACGEELATQAPSSPVGGVYSFLCASFDLSDALPVTKDELMALVLKKVDTFFEGDDGPAEVIASLKEAVATNGQKDDGSIRQRKPKPASAPTSPTE